MPVAPLEAGPATLDVEAARYVTRVHRLEVGDTFVAFDPRETIEAVATIVEIAARVTIDVGDVAPGVHLPPREVTLFQGIPKGGKLDDIVRDATELGVTRVVLVTCARSQGGAAAPRADRLGRVALEAARQCGRGDVPEIIGPVRFDALAGAPGVRVALVPDATRAFADAVAADGPVSIAIGPEGGLDPREIAALEEWSFGLVRLGPFVMRTETAAAAALGALWSHFGHVFAAPTSGTKKAT